MLGTPLSECLQQRMAGKLTRSQLCAMCQWREEHGPVFQPRNTQLQSTEIIKSDEAQAQLLLC